MIQRRSLKSIVKNRKTICSNRGVGWISCAYPPDLILECGCAALIHPTRSRNRSPYVIRGFCVPNSRIAYGLRLFTFSRFIKQGFLIVRFLNPRTHFAFKHIFASAESSDSLVSLLNAILNSTISYRIVAASMLDVKLAPKLKALDEIDFYVRAQDQRDKNYLIGIQILNLLGYENRALSLACQHDVGAFIQTEYNALSLEFIVITLSDFVLFGAYPDFIRHFTVSKNLDDGNNLQSVFVELPKFDKQQAALETTLDKWIYFLKHAATLQAIPETLAIEQPIARALQRAEYATLTDKEQDTQQKSLFFIQDQHSAVVKAKRLGFEEGLAQGLKLAEQHKTILALFANGLSVEFIANALNLAIDQVQQQMAN